MRVLQVLGVVLIFTGVGVLWKRPMYPTHKDVLSIGEFKASVEQREAVPLWIGAVAAGVGVGLLLVGGRRRT